MVCGPLVKQRHNISGHLHSMISQVWVSAVAGLHKDDRKMVCCALVKQRHNSSVVTCNACKWQQPRVLARGTICRGMPSSKLLLEYCLVRQTT
jgi:hypothetical protein